MDGKQWKGVKQFIDRQAKARELKSDAHPTPGSRYTGKLTKPMPFKLSTPKPASARVAKSSSSDVYADAGVVATARSARPPMRKPLRRSASTISARSDGISHVTEGFGVSASGLGKPRAKQWLSTADRSHMIHRLLASAASPPHSPSRSARALPPRASNTSVSPKPRCQSSPTSTMRWANSAQDAFDDAKSAQHHNGYCAGENITEPSKTVRLAPFGGGQATDTSESHATGCMSGSAAVPQRGSVTHIQDCVTPAASNSKRPFIRQKLRNLHRKTRGKRARGRGKSASSRGRGRGAVTSASVSARGARKPQYVPKKSSLAPAKSRATAVRAGYAARHSAPSRPSPSNACPQNKDGDTNVKLRRTPSASGPSKSVSDILATPTPRHRVPASHTSFVSDTSATTQARTPAPQSQCVGQPLLSVDLDLDVLRPHTPVTQESFDSPTAHLLSLCAKDAQHGFASPAKSDFSVWTTTSTATGVASLPPDFEADFEHLLSTIAAASAPSPPAAEHVAQEVNHNEHDPPLGGTGEDFDRLLDRTLSKISGVPVDHQEPDGDQVQPLPHR